MNRVLGFLVVVIGLIGLSACSSTSCTIQDEVVSVISTNFIATGLECTNPKQVAADLVAFTSNYGLCKKASTEIKGPIANAVCPLVSAAVVDFVKNNGIPASWGCSATAASAIATDKLTQLCLKLPLAQKP